MQIATLEILEGAQFPAAQVRAIAKVFEAFENTWRSDLVTVPVLDARLAELKGELKTELHSHIGGLRSEMHEFRGELKAEIQGVVVALRSEAQDSRGELKAKTHDVEGSLRGEIHEVAGGLKAEIHEVAGSLRAEMHAIAGGLRAEMHSIAGDLKASIQAAKSETSRWILLAIMGQSAVYFGMMYFLLEHIR